MWRTIIVSLALICLLLLGWYAVRKFPGRIEADLQLQAQTALGSRVPNVVVRASQRHLVLSGVVATDADRAAAETLARDQSGVKTVENQIVVEAGGAAPTPLPTEPTEPTSDAQNPGPADTATNSVNAPDAGAAPPDGPSVLEMEALEPDEPTADVTAEAQVAEVDATATADAEAKAPEGPTDTAVAPAPTGNLTAAQCKEAVQAAIEGDKRITFVGLTGKFTPEGEAKLDEVWAILSRCPDTKGTIEAYHDDYGDPDKLKTLTQVRAYNTHKRLVDQGMPEKRFRYVGLGYRNMRYGGRPGMRVLNQRVEFNITVE